MVPARRIRPLFSPSVESRARRGASRRLVGLLLASSLRPPTTRMVRWLAGERMHERTDDARPTATGFLAWGHIGAPTASQRPPTGASVTHWPRRSCDDRSREWSSTSIAATSVRPGTWAIRRALPLAGHEDMTGVPVRGPWEPPRVSARSAGSTGTKPTTRCSSASVSAICRLRRRAFTDRPAEAVEPGLWSASRYVWHTVDVLRFGTERLWTISADPPSVSRRGTRTSSPRFAPTTSSHHRGPDRAHRGGRCVAHRGLRGTTRCLDTAPRGRCHLRLRRRPAATRTRCAITSGTFDAPWATDKDMRPRPLHAAPPSEGRL